MATKNPPITGDNVATINEFYPHVVDLAPGDATVIANTALLREVYINTTLSAHAVEIQNNGSTVFVIPASAAAGAWFMFGDTTLTEDLSVKPNASATGSITIIAKSMPRA